MVEDTAVIRAIRTALRADTDGMADVLCKGIETVVFKYVPAIDAVPVRHGHWIEDPDDWEYQCSECRHLSSCRTIYCSACGARMYGKGNGNEAD